MPRPGHAPIDFRPPDAMERFVRHAVLVWHVLAILVCWAISVVIAPMDILWPNPKKTFARPLNVDQTEQLSGVGTQISDRYGVLLCQCWQTKQDCDYEFHCIAPLKIDT
jgi:hypothetical protein